MAAILIVDDDHLFRDAMCRVIENIGHTPVEAATLKEGLEQAASGDYLLVLLDVWLPDGNGLASLQDFRACPCEPEVIILTGAGDPDGAEMAIRSGAWDYIAKPASISDIKLPVLRAIDYRQKALEHEAPVLHRSRIIGSSPAIRACLDVVAQAAANDSEVLITGDTGTGKELFARAIHENSARAEGPFVVVDCAALPEKLVESTLFGHEKGAFTGADRKADGLVKQANHGTLFLDEVGELPLSAQRAFLRVLQEHRFRPVGSRHEESSDFRLIAATNRDLDALVEHWEFRRDLLFRLKTILITLPPLTDRREDIEELVRHSISRYGWRVGSGTKRFSPEYLEALKSYDWPGNVRELLSAVSCSISAAKGSGTLFPRHLPTAIRVHRARARLKATPSPQGRGLDQLATDDFPSFRDYRAQRMADAEQHYLRELMALCGGSVPQACDVSGLSRARLYALLKTHDIPRGSSAAKKPPPEQGPSSADT
ncbi:sigma-54-dependent transcriptional regulator [Desulfobaculum sp. SPO524]|uniref:sigma-54-dependent transcriptional regulator n=1 Tax=Desulfobaculum sp. SPO524 TaxID=3378071 RepID=UPI003852E190